MKKQTVLRMTRKELAFNLVIAGAVVLFIILLFRRNNIEELTPPTDTLIELHQLVKSPLLEIVIQSEQTNQKMFRYSIKDKDTLRKFHEAVSDAARDLISGRSEPTYRCIMTLVTSTSKKKYRASVHRDESEDLFLTAELNTKDTNGTYSQPNYSTVRLSGLGKWISKVAPDGAI